MRNAAASYPPESNTLSARVLAASPQHSRVNKDSLWLSTAQTPVRHGKGVPGPGDGGFYYGTVRVMVMVLVRFSDCIEGYVTAFATVPVTGKA